MSHLKAGTSVIRPCISSLGTTEDISDLQESDNQQLRQTQLAGEECARLIRNAAEMGKKNITGRNKSWSELRKTGCLYSHYQSGSGSCAMLRLESRARFQAYMHFSLSNLDQPPILDIQRVN